MCKCQTPHLQESVIQQRFQAAVQELLQKRKAILENCQVMLELLTDCTDLEYQLQELETQKMRISEQVQGYVRENSEIVQDQEKYEERYQALVGQYEPLQKQETALQEQRAERLARREQIQGFQNKHDFSISMHHCFFYSSQPQLFIKFWQHPILSVQYSLKALNLFPSIAGTGNAENANFGTGAGICSGEQ